MRVGANIAVMAPVIRAQGLSKRYGATLALDRLDLNVRD
jgi:hypothetical protein